MKSTGRANRLYNKYDVKAKIHQSKADRSRFGIFKVPIYTDYQQNRATVNRIKARKYAGKATKTMNAAYNAAANEKMAIYRAKQWG